MDNFSTSSSSQTHLSGEANLVVGELKYDFKIKGFGTWQDLAGQRDLPSIKSEKIVILLRDGGIRKIQLGVEDNADIRREWNTYEAGCIKIKVSIVN